ncbi:MAG TPA: formylmethanofuran dehydrogenase subunit C [Dongiaceae bacterium]|nr:formylmethanofuran dehydrogenase subunit C [Dongiaceae bacterium]
MSLRLALRAGALPAGARVDAAGLAPEHLAAIDPAAAARATVPTTAGDAAIGDLFTLTRTAGPDAALELEGDLGRFDRLGSGMTRGRLTVEGNAGHRAGEGMRGGILLICGDAGDEAGAPLPGAPEGQAGGVLIVRGRAGACAGYRMRRGFMALGGAGDAAGAALIAGTMLLLSAPGAGTGAMMRRGTIVVLGPFQPGPMFARSGRTVAPWLGPYVDAMAAAGLGAPVDPATATFVRYRGDLADGALGEILVREER